MSDNTFSIRIREGLRQEVEDYAKSMNRSRSFVVNEAIESFMRDRREYLAAIDEALAEADKGIFISGEAVSEWLRSWGTDNELPPPDPDIFPDQPS